MEASTKTVHPKPSLLVVLLQNGQTETDAAEVVQLKMICLIVLFLFSEQPKQVLAN